MFIRSSSLIWFVTPIEMMRTPESRSSRAALVVVATSQVGFPSVRMMATLGTAGRSPRASEPNNWVRANCRAYVVLVVSSRNGRRYMAFTKSSSVEYLNNINPMHMCVHVCAYVFNVCVCVRKCRYVHI